PRTAWRTPRSSASETSATAARPPKWRPRPWARRSGSATRPPRDAGQAPGEKEDESDDGEPPGQRPVLGRRRERFPQGGEDERAGEAAAEPADAAEDDHEEDVARALPGQVVGVDEAVAAGEQISGQSGQCAGNGEARQPVTVDAVTERSHALLVGLD